MQLVSCKISSHVAIIFNFPILSWTKHNACCDLVSSVVFDFSFLSISTTTTNSIYFKAIDSSFELSVVALKWLKNEEQTDLVDTFWELRLTMKNIVGGHQEEERCRGFVFVSHRTNVIISSTQVLTIEEVISECCMIFSCPFVRRYVSKKCPFNLYLNALTCTQVIKRIFFRTLITILWQRMNFTSLVIGVNFYVCTFASTIRILLLCYNIVKQNGYRKEIHEFVCQSNIRWLVGIVIHHFGHVASAMVPVGYTQVLQHSVI